mgnify:CR=1 FL=1
MFIELFELGKESYNVNIIVYYIYANYTIYIQLTCIIYLNYFYWYHFGSSKIPTSKFKYGLNYFTCILF